MPKYEPGDTVNLIPGYTPRQLTIVEIRPKAPKNCYKGVSTHARATGRPIVFGDDVIAEKVGHVDPTTVDVRNVRQEREDNYDVELGQRFALTMAERHDGEPVSDQWLALALLSPGDTVKIRRRQRSGVKVTSATFQRVMMQGERFNFTAKLRPDSNTIYKFPVTSVVV